MVAEPILLLAAVVFGLVFGSFLNVCIVRLPNEDPKARSLIKPPSSCPKCGREIVWYDNIPVVSWLALRGKCRWCGAPISKQYPLIEILVAVLWVGAALVYGATPHFLEAALFFTVLLGIAVIDARHYVIPDELSYGGLILGLAMALGAGGGAGLIRALIGAVAGGAVLWLVRVAGGWVFKQEAMGMGDVKMLAMIGAFVGWRGVLLTVFLGALVGLLIFLPLQLRKKRLVPFGVFLAVGAGVAFLFGDSIISWYVQFLYGM